MSNNWSDDELRAAIEVYIEMLNLERKAKTYFKTDYYKKLSKRFDRSPGAFEYRMQNISHILDLQGRQWIQGLKPYQNVGSNVSHRIENILSEIEGKKFEASASFDAEVRRSKNEVESKPPKGNKSPRSSNSEITQYERDPKVVAWILNQANGICECCDNSAPFLKGNGDPYLEVHHIMRLADGGEDTVYNAIAICPNCHRKLHFGKGKKDLARTMVEKIDRLSTEL